MFLLVYINQKEHACLFFHHLSSSNDDEAFIVFSYALAGEVVYGQCAGVGCCSDAVDGCRAFCQMEGIGLGSHTTAQTEVAYRGRDGGGAALGYLLKIIVSGIVAVVDGRTGALDIVVDERSCERPVV